MSGRAHRGLMAREKEANQAGARMGDPSQLKIGSDLQGEPIFCLTARRRLLRCHQEGRVGRLARKEETGEDDTPRTPAIGARVP